MAEAVASAFKLSKLVLATTTYNAGIFPFMHEFISHLTERGFKNRKVAFIENGSWAPMAEKVMRGMLEGSKDIEYAESSVRILSAPNADTYAKLEALAEELTRLVHGEAGLQTALGATKTLFGGDISGKSAAELSQIFKDVKSAELPAVEIVGKCVYAVAAAAGMFKSNGEARRMAAQGGLSLNGAKVDDKRIFESSDLIDGELAVLRQGKKANFLLRAKN
jgi:tyrosyl-tRNA synthetase